MINIIELKEIVCVDKSQFNNISIDVLFNILLFNHICNLVFFFVLTAAAADTESTLTCLECIRKYDNIYVTDVDISVNRLTSECAYLWF